MIDFHKSRNLKNSLVLAINGLIWQKSKNVESFALSRLNWILQKVKFVEFTGINRSEVKYFEVKNLKKVKDIR